LGDGVAERIKAGAIHGVFRSVSIELKTNWFISEQLYDGRNTPRFYQQRKTPVGLRTNQKRLGNGCINPKNVLPLYSDMYPISSRVNETNNHS